MAYGVSCNTFLLSLGIPPGASSASVHASEMFTTAVSGFSHLKLGNVKVDLFKKLLIPGILGGVLGAYLLTSFPGDVIKSHLYLTNMNLYALKHLKGGCRVYPVRNSFQVKEFANSSMMGITVAESLTFLLTIGFTHWSIILGLIIGGVIGAPIAASVCKKIPHRLLMKGVGILIIVLSLRTIFLLRK